MISKATYQR